MLERLDSHEVVLQVAAEVFPLVKTGGPGRRDGRCRRRWSAAWVHEVRLLLPGLPAIADAVLHQKPVCQLGAASSVRRALRTAARPDALQPAAGVRRRRAVPVPPPRQPLPGQPDGHEWPDNLQRFALLGWVAAHLAAGELDPSWLPDVDARPRLACGDGLRLHRLHNPGHQRPYTVFTVHNLAYQGLFPHHDFPLLGLPWQFMQTHGVEFHGQLSFMKAGLKYARRITTVSPTYAREIATHDFGSGLDGVIRSRGHDVSGILNGVDPAVWSPEQDTAIASRYSAREMAGKARCKVALQVEMGLTPDPKAPLFGLVSRLTSQKGLDLLLGALPALLLEGAQLALQGSGDAALEAAFVEAARANPGRVAVRLGYDEALAHRVVAGADAILVPSRFEPCGLTQLYGLRYGTLPVVRRVGGLADTVVDAGKGGKDGGTGFVFDAATPSTLADAVSRAVAAFHDPARWSALMRRAMAQDHSWAVPAREYMTLYASLAD